MTELQLRGKSRWLVVGVQRHGSTVLTVAAYGGATKRNYWDGEQIAFAWAEPTKCRLTRDHGDAYTSLWVDSAAFRVSDTEADQIAERCVLLGLCDRRSVKAESEVLP
jgi:hypothetical protein